MPNLFQVQIQPAMLGINVNMIVGLQLFSHDLPLFPKNLNGFVYKLHWPHQHQGHADILGEYDSRIAIVQP